MFLECWRALHSLISDFPLRIALGDFPDDPKECLTILGTSLTLPQVQNPHRDDFSVNLDQWRNGEEHTTSFFSPYHLAVPSAFCFFLFLFASQPQKYFSVTYIHSKLFFQPAVWNNDGIWSTPFERSSHCSSSVTK